MATILVNGREIPVGDQERLNGIQAAERAGVEIPHYCWHAGLTVVASCRMCLVESGTRNKDTPARHRPKTARCSSPTATR